MIEALVGITGVESIEERMRGNIGLALDEGSLYFDRQGSVWRTLRRITRFLNDEGLPYAVVGGLALFHHGYRRYTENVNLLVTAASVDATFERCSEFVRRHTGGRTFLDRETGVSVRFSIDGASVGNRAGGSVRFPHPGEIAETDDGIQFVNLPTLVSLKLAAGPSSVHRARDLGDVQELIKTLYLTESLASHVHCDVREVYVAMCREIDAASGPFLLLWNVEPQLGLPTSLEALIAAGNNDSATLEAMCHDGVALFAKRPFYGGCAVLTTNDRIIGKKYEMHHESEYLFRD